MQVPESAANGECGAWSQQLGSFTQTTAVNPAVLQGWGTRNRDCNTASACSRNRPAGGLEVSYNRRVWTNFFSL
jgi:hypothetical protein